jgi:5-methylthioadenosine/S-adenosylhomocysteine deaminase
MTNRTILRGGHLLTMDAGIGDLPVGDVLIEDELIAEVGRRIDADAEVVEAAGKIVIPGFVDTHRHTWETAIRGCAPDATLDDYFAYVKAVLAPAYQAGDVYASNLAGSLECLNAGITTLVDWSHINNTRQHPDAAIGALRETGIRAQYAYGCGNSPQGEHWNDNKVPIPTDDVRRVRETYFSSDHGPLTMALAARGPGLSAPDVVRDEFRTARDLDIPVTMHVAMGRVAGRAGMVRQLGEMGLLRDGTTYVHACHLTEDEWRMVAGSGGHISVAPQVELQMGHGWPPVAKALSCGLPPSLSADVVTSAPGDMFTQMRAAFGCERARVHAECWAAGTPVPGTMPTARQMLEMATINGARGIGLGERTGSLTPGKQADIVVIDAAAINLSPVTDPVAAVVTSADVSNVEHVLVAGTFRKRDGKLLADTTRARGLVEAARDAILARAGRREPVA